MIGRQDISRAALGLCLCLFACAAWPQPPQKAYRLAIPRRSGEAGIDVFNIGADAEVLSTATLRVPKNPFRIFQNGKVLYMSRFRANSSVRISPSVFSEEVEKALSTGQKKVDAKDVTEFEAALDRDILTSTCLAFLTSKGILKQRHPSIYSLFVRSPDDSSSSWRTTSFSQSDSRRYIPVTLQVEDRDYKPTDRYPVLGNKYSCYFNVLLLFDTSQRQWIHVCGSESERFFFGACFDLREDRQLLFYRNENYKSIGLCT